MNLSRATLVALSLAALLGLGVVMFVCVSPPTTQAMPGVASNVATTTASPAPTPTLPSATAKPTQTVVMDSNEKRIPRSNELPVGELARDYAALAAKARTGDVEAAYRLYEGTSSCAEAPGDVGDLAGRLAEIERGAADESERAREQIFARTQYERCAPLSADQRRAWRDWLKLAASLGNVDAQLIYVNAGAPQKANTGQYWKDVDEYRDAATRYLDARIASGNPKALLAAAATYDGFNNTVLNQPDPIRRYAYLYAYTLAMGGEDNTFVDSLAEGQEALGPTEVAQAQRLGEQIFGTCCKH